MKRTIALLILSLAVFQVPATLAAQTPPAAAVDAGTKEALKLLEAGNVDGAIEKLEALRQAGAPPQVLSLLGAVYVRANKPKEALEILKPLAEGPDADPAVLYNAGRAAMLQGQVPEGSTYFMRSVQKEPSSPAGRDLGLLLAREGRVVEAYSLLRPWSIRNPTDGDARLMAASLAVQLERPEEAEELLTGLAADDPALQLLRGRARAQKGDGAGAVALLQPLLANHPAGMDLEVRRALAEAYLSAGQPAEAVKLLTGRVGNVPSLVLLLGRAQKEAGDAPAALATLKPLADRIPENRDALPDPRPAVGIAVEYGALLVAAGRSAEAVPLLEKATRLHPGGRDGWSGLAQALDAAGRKDDAAKARSEADKLAQAAAARPAPPARPAVPAPAAPPSPAAAATAATAAPAPALSANLQEAMRLTTAGQTEPALAIVQKEIAASPNDLQARMLEVRLLLTLKRHQDAFKSAEAALALEPGNPDLVYQRGAVAMGLNDLAAAEQDLRRAIQLAPGHTAAMNDLAVLLISQKKTAEAQALLEQVLKLNPKDQMAAANLQQIKGGANP